MRKSKFSEHQIIAILKALRQDGQCATFVASIRSVRPLGRGGKQSMGMEAADIGGCVELEEENRRLKQMHTEFSLEHRLLKEVLPKKPYRRKPREDWWRA